MPRPNRLYTIDGKYYYIKDGKKVFVKVPAGVSQKQVSKINIKNIIKLAESKRVVRKKKRRNLAYQKKIAPVLQKSETGGLPIYFFKPSKNIPTLEEQAKASDDTNVEKLAKLLLKDSKLVPSSSKLPSEPTIVKELTPAEKSQQAYEKAMAERNRIAEERKKAQEEQAAIEAGKRQSLIDETRRKKGKTTMKPYVTGLATTIYEGKMETGTTPTKEQIRGEYPPGAKISTPTFEKAVPKAREKSLSEIRKKAESQKGTIPSFFQSMKKMISPAKISPSPGEKPDEILKGTPAKPKNLEKQLTNVVEEEMPISLKRTTGGEGYGSDGLYDDEIETIARKRLKDYIPCIAKDETNELMKYVKKGDKQFSFIINTDDSSSGGRHWRAVYINNRDDYPSIEYFDPLTEGKPEQSLIDICRKIAIKMNPSKLFKYKQNMIRRQSKLSSNCGYHCIHFLEGRYMGIPFSEITGYDDFVEKMKKQHGELDGSGKGEAEIQPFMKKYDSYI
jgi:hypothetical protein